MEEERREKKYPFRLLLVELQRTAFSEEMERLFSEGRAKEKLPPVELYTYAGDVSRLPRYGISPFVFVLPGTSIGFTNGGVDHVYSRVMFPGCERNIRDKIRSSGPKTDLGQPYLPVGSAVVVRHPDHPNAVSTNGKRLPFFDTFLIAAPTMFLPRDVSSTRNAYHAFTAVLKVFASSADIPSDAPLICPALCCGYGRMDPRESARQMFRAYVDLFREEEKEKEKGREKEDREKKERRLCR